MEVLVHDYFSLLRNYVPFMYGLLGDPKKALKSRPKVWYFTRLENLFLKGLRRLFTSAWYLAVFYILLYQLCTYDGKLIQAGREPT